MRPDPGDGDAGENRTASAMSGGLGFSFGTAIHDTVGVAEIVGQAQRLAGDAFLTQTAELILQSDTASGELKLDQALSNQKAMNRS